MIGVLFWSSTIAFACSMKAWFYFKIKDCLETMSSSFGMISETVSLITLNQEFILSVTGWEVIRRSAENRHSSWRSSSGLRLSLSCNMVPGELSILITFYWSSYIRLSSLIVPSTTANFSSSSEYAVCRALWLVTPYLCFS